MSLYPNIDMYCKTAKRGTWKRMGDTVKALTKLYITSPSTVYDVVNGTSETVMKTQTCDFSTKTDGGWFLRVEGTLRNVLLLVLPDNSVDLNGISGTGGTIDDAFRAVIAYEQTSGIPGWDGFVQWFDGKWSQYGAFANAVSFSLQTPDETDYTVGTIPSYSNSGHDVGVWLAWLMQIVTGSGAEGTAFSDWYDANEERYVFRLHAAVQTYTIDISINLTI